MADPNEMVGQTALDLISQLRKANFSPELAEQAVTTKDYAQIPPGYRPPIERPATAGYDYGSTFWDKLYENLMGAHEGMVGGWQRGGLRGAGEMALGTLGGASAIPSAVLEQYVSEPIATSERLQRTVGEKPAAFLGGLAETIPWFLMGGPKKVPKGVQPRGRPKIPRVAPGKATYTDKTGFGTEMMERRGPSRMSDEEWANLHRQGEMYKTPNPEGQAITPQGVQPQTFRDPISHRQTEMDPGFFGPLIENYYKTLAREGIGPSMSGGAPAGKQIVEGSGFAKRKPSGVFKPGLFGDPESLKAHQAYSEGLTRPWPGVYKGKVSEGRTQPKSYRKPKTYDLSEYE